MLVTSLGQSKYSFPSSDLTLGEKGTPPVWTITSNTSTLSNISFGLSILYQVLFG